jgi:hypothetical protein
MDYNIMDIFYNDDGEYVVIHDGTRPRIDVRFMDGTPFIMHECSEGRGRVYTLLKDLVSRTEVTLCIQGSLKTFNINLWPSYPDEIIMATCVKNEDEYVLQWMKYHEALGISRFIFYDNSKSPVMSYNSGCPSLGRPSRLREVLSGKNALVIDWPYHGNGFQSGQENHAINAFRKSRFIGMFDVDEYMNPQNAINGICELLPIEDTGGYLMLSKTFKNPLGLPEHDFEFLKIHNCNQIVYGANNVNGSKIWVRPANVRTMLVHDITNGKQPTRIDPEVAYFNHYRFLNKMRDRDDATDVDSSISRNIERYMC